MICQICELKINKICKVVGNVKIFECSNCQLGFLNPKDTILGRSTRDGNKSDLYDFKSYKKEENKLRQRYERLVKIIMKYKKSGNVLDVGSGFGLFSSTLQSRGNFNTDLIEPEQKLQYVNKLKFLLYKTTFEKYKNGGKKYDIILMMDVLEHFRDPLSNLKKAKSLLKKDGILVLQTPNYKSLMARICKDWAWWMIEDHKFFFSPKSINLLLKKAGFEIEYLTTYEDFEDFKKNLDGNFMNIKNELIRKITKVVFFTFFIPFYFLTRKILWQCNFGGLIFLIFRKKN